MAGPLAASLRLVVSALLLFVVESTVSAADLKFSIRYEAALRSEPFSGRVTLYFSDPLDRPEKGAALPQPRLGPNWFRPGPMLSLDVKDWRPGEDLVLSTQTEGVIRFPVDLKDDSLRGRAVQAVARFNPWEREVGRGPGNGFGQAVHVDQTTADVALRLDSLVPAEPFRDTKWSRELAVPSAVLSQFHGREVVIRACVTVPTSYLENSDRKYPVVFIIPGFGGTHRMDRREATIGELVSDGIEFIRVTLDPSCPYGHHVFADSANNGPWGTALVTEFIPALDKAYRTDPRPVGRFLTGHSSGGWSSLWLQVAWPEVFNGTWSTSPDPVDFHDFQRIDLYADANVWRDAEGNRRPIARRGETPVLWFDSFDQMELAVGHGGQLLSFDAVFGPRGEDGQPRLAWDRSTGAIDHEVVAHWKQYDIVDKLRREWPELKPKLAGKLHVVMGELDTFFLEGATKRLKTALVELGSDAVVEIVPGKDHGNLLTWELGVRLRREMGERYLATRDR